MRVLVVARLVIAACVSGAPSAYPSTIDLAVQVPPVRDSAGVRIVENVRPSWTAGTRWRIAATPRVRLGVL